jgi:PKHD-type hydroxylase
LIHQFQKALSATSAAELRAAVDAPASTRLVSELISELRAHPEFDVALHPGALSLSNFSRQRPGASSESLVAPALVEPDPKLRVDVRVLVWLSDSGAYEGGEVLIDEGGAITRFRCQAGDAIAYPASARRSLTPVSRGELLLCTLEVQSLIAGEIERRVLLEFNRALREFERRPESARHAETMRRVCNELIRMWAVFPRRASAP